MLRTRKTPDGWPHSASEAVGPEVRLTSLHMKRRGATMSVAISQHATTAGRGSGQIFSWETLASQEPGYVQY